MPVLKLHSFHTAKEDRFNPDRHDRRGTDNHILALDIADGNGDELLGIMLGHNVIAVPFLKLLNGHKADFFPVAIGEKKMNRKFVRFLHGKDG
ncbi:MAG: hypothetical protein RLZZ490_565 [Cyanobacteriota bacterium]